VSEDNTADQTDDERRAAGLSPVTGQRAPKFAGPRAVNVSFWLWITGVAVLILSQVLSLSLMDQITDSAVKSNAVPNFTPDQIRDAVHARLWLLFFGALVFGLLIALFAYKMREGTRSARTVVTVLAVLTTLFNLVFFIGALLVVLAILLFVIAVILLYLPSVQPYFPKVGRKL
jgi:hypothetical protein